LRTAPGEAEFLRLENLLLEGCSQHDQAHARVMPGVSPYVMAKNISFHLRTWSFACHLHEEPYFFHSSSSSSAWGKHTPKSDLVLKKPKNS
jgi:hypothetical protein